MVIINLINTLNCFRLSVKVRVMKIINSFKSCFKGN